MSMIGNRLWSWCAANLSGGGPDYAATAAAPPRDAVVKGAAVGAGVGAAAGAGYAAYSVHNDTTYVRYRNEIVDRAARGGDPSEVLGAEADPLIGQVRERADRWRTDQSVTATVRYLSHLKELRPDTPVAILQSAHATLENHLGGDGQVREAVNLISAYLEKNPQATVYDGVADYVNAYNGAERKSDAAAAFMQQHGITQDDLRETVLRMELAHTSPLARFGMAGGIVVGAAGGAVAGAAVGAAVVVAVHYIKR